MIRGKVILEQVELLKLHLESCFAGDDYEELLIRIIDHFSHDSNALEAIGQVMDGYSVEMYEADVTETLKTYIK